MYTLDRFEDAGLAVLETESGESLTVPRAELPAGVLEGDVLSKLPWTRWNGDVRYAAEPALTAERRRESQQLRAELPTYKDEGDVEL